VNACHCDFPCVRATTMTLFNTNPTAPKFTPFTPVRAALARCEAPDAAGRG
jgi:hypothetical protein